MVDVKERSDNAVSKRAVLLVATMASFLTPFMGSSLNVALPSIGREFGMDAVLLNWVATSFLLAAAVFLLPFGRVADIYGRKKVFIFGIFIYTVSAFLSAISTSGATLIFYRVLQGIGAAMTAGTAVAILTSVFPPGERGKVLGINVAVVYTGLSAGPFLGGLLIEHFGWRSIFLANVPLGLIIITAVFWKLKGEWAEARGEKFDFVGSIIYGCAIIAIMYGFSTLPQISAIGIILVGIAGILIFIRWETKTASPALHMSLFRHNTVFTFSNLAALIHYSATFAVSFLLSLYLQYIKGVGPQYAGLVLIAMPVMQVICSPIAGRLSDRIEPRILASVGMLLTTVGLISLTFLSQDTTMEYIIGSLIVLGLGFGLFSSPNTNAVMSSVEKRFYGVAAATLATMRQLGMMFSMGMVMLIFAVFIGRVEITPQYYPVFISSVKIAFTIFAILCLAGVFASFARGKTHFES